MDLNLDIRNRLGRAEETLLLSLEKGECALSAYQLTWASLLTDIQTATAQCHIDTDTLSIAFSVASNVSVLAGCFADIEREDQTLKSRWRQDLSAIFEDLTLSDSSPHLSGGGTSTPASPTTHSSPGPTFICAAYQWLLENLHNPYPSPQVKASIAMESGCSVSTVSAWFVNVRRRMGWTTICRDYFHNCRADGTAAAYHALVKEDPDQKLAPEVTHAFMVMKVTAEGLYSSSFSKSALACDLDVLVKDMTANDRLRQEQEKERTPRDKLGVMEGKELNNQQRAFGSMVRTTSDAAKDYLSPEVSRSPSPLPVLEHSTTDESEDDREMSPPRVAGRKRCATSALSDLDNSDGFSKRPRFSETAFTSSCLPLFRKLPSPPETTFGTTDLSDNGPSGWSFAPICANAPPTRKRRLSDANTQGLPKRPRTSAIGPRVHAVSDPLPMRSITGEDGVDDWFNDNFARFFDIPPPVDRTEPDQSALWEIELFNGYSIPRKYDQLGPSSPATATLCTQACQATPDSVLPSTSSTIDFYALLNSFGECNPDSSTSNQEIDLPPPDVPLSVDVLSQDASDSLQSTNWTELLNLETPASSNVDLAVNCSTDSLDARDFSKFLPEIDTLQVSVDQSNEDFPNHTRKQTKLDQLKALQEACRLMEREIRGEALTV
ncbi:C-terminal domain of homeodomain 1-domain-containing protein [Phlebopus sp. FC_14]|nr:C-terminal domain of homeodomain 1-domain-containing protein [Phlebopus sp. FC_14]